MVGIEYSYEHKSRVSLWLLVLALANQSARRLTGSNLHRSRIDTTQIPSVAATISQVSAMINVVQLALGSESAQEPQRGMPMPWHGYRAAYKYHPADRRMMTGRPIRRSHEDTMLSLPRSAWWLRSTFEDITGQMSFAGNAFAAFGCEGRSCD